MNILTVIFKHGLIQCEQPFMLYLFLLVKKKGFSSLLNECIFNYFIWGLHLGKKILKVC